MSIQLISPKLAFREITYKLKKEKLESAGPIPAKITINLANSSINPSGNGFVFLMPVKVVLDTDDMFFEGKCLFKAEMNGVVGADLAEKKTFIESNKDHIGTLSTELLRVVLNKRVNDVLAMTVTAPSESVEFWPIPKESQDAS